MSYQAKISVIIPVFNTGVLLEETLCSVRDQTYPNWECLVVDDGSKVETINIIKKYSSLDPRFQLLRRPENRKKGGNACRNIGFEGSSADFIQWFDADDLMHPEMLEKKIHCIESTNSDFVVCEGVEFSETVKNLKNKWTQVKSIDPLQDHALGKINFHTNGPLFRKSFLLDKKLFEESLQRKQEWEFFTRLLSYNPAYEILNEVLFFYRQHGQSINGLNSKATLWSRTKAERLVFQTLMKARFYEVREEYFLRRHFFLKTCEKVKLARESNSWRNLGYALWTLRTFLTPGFLFHIFKKIAKNPIIIKNMFGREKRT